MTQWGLDTLFNPAKRHMDEEKRRLQSTREEVGDNSGGKRIDLESGKVRIQRRSADDEQADEATDTDATDDGTAEESGASETPAAPTSAPSSAPSASGRPAPSAAAIRAARRRGREPR